MRFKVIIIGLLISLNGFSQEDITKLTVEKIMQDPDSWIGNLPDDIVWSEDSKEFYFNWNPENTSKNPLYKVNVNDLSPKEISTDKQKETPGRNNFYSKDGKRKAA